METERTVYVVYAPGLGFGKGTGVTACWTDCFTKARVFKGSNHAQTSGIYRKARHNGVAAIVMPVKLVLDPEQLFEVILSGKSK